MGFAAMDLDKCSQVCGGLRTVAGALNWLLIHVPEERIPPDLGSTPAAGSGRGGGGGGRATVAGDGDIYSV